MPSSDYQHLSNSSETGATFAETAPKGLPGAFRYSKGGADTPPLTDAARDALFIEFQPLAHRLIGQYGANAEMRQDLAGEIYFRFCALLDLYDPARGVPLRAYLVRQLSASIFTYARQQWRQGRRESSLEAGGEGLWGGGGCADPTRQWDDRLAAEQVAAMLPEAVARLTNRQAQILIWRYYEDWSYERIAEALDVRPATIRSLLRHALSNLRRWFAQRSLPHDED